MSGLCLNENEGDSLPAGFDLRQSEIPPHDFDQDDKTRRWRAANRG
jgi:hypothetical protein